MTAKQVSANANSDDAQGISTKNFRQPREPASTAVNNLDHQSTTDESPTTSRVA